MDVKRTRIVKTVGWLCMALSIGLMLTSIALSDGDQSDRTLLVVGLGLLVVGILALFSGARTRAGE